MVRGPRNRALRLRDYELGGRAPASHSMANLITFEAMVIDSDDALHQISIDRLRNDIENAKKTIDLTTYRRNSNFLSNQSNLKNYELNQHRKNPMYGHLVDDILRERDRQIGEERQATLDIMGDHLTSNLQTNESLDEDI